METTRSARLLRTAREVLGKRANRAEEEGAEAGFTLIELMVVLLILAILLAIAIPTFLGVTVTANDRAAQSDLTNAVTSAKANYVNAQSYPASAAEVTSLTASEPSLTYTTGASTSDNDLSVTTGNGGATLVLFSNSTKTDHCWVAADNESTTADVTTLGATASIGPGTTYSEFSTTTPAATTCDAAGIPAGGLTFGSSYPAA